MRFFTIIQDSGAYDAGYNVGYMIGKILPFILLVVIGYFLYRYFNKKSKK